MVAPARREDDMKRLRAMLLGLVGVLPLSATGADPVVLGQVDLSFYAVTGGVVQEVLERSGQPFVVTQGSHGEIYPRLGTGEVDILAASWLPNAHAALYEKVRAHTFVVAELYRDARLFLAVPDYADPSIRSIADLARPEVAAGVEKRIVGIGPTSGLMVGAAKMMESYGLRAAGYELIAGPAADWVANFRRAHDQASTVVMPLWQPQWLNASYRLRILDDPQKIFADGDSAYLVANKALTTKVTPEVLDRLKRIRLSVAAVTAMDRMVNVDRLTPREAARRWIASEPELTRDWFPAAP
jgi:glycine betaine/proline transport system substrate-binding protein